MKTNNISTYNSLKMNNLNLQKVIIAETSDFILSCDSSGTILYQEHFKTHSFSRYEIRVILNALSSGTYKFYVIKVNDGNLLPSEDLAWVERLNLKRLFKAGILHIAYISPQNVFNSFEMEKEVRPANILKIRIFKKISDALQWLEFIMNGNEIFPDIRER